MSLANISNLGIFYPDGRIRSASRFLILLVKLKVTSHKDAKDYSWAINYLKE